MTGTFSRTEDRRATRPVRERTPGAAGAVVWRFAVATVLAGASVLTAVAADDSRVIFPAGAARPAAPAAGGAGIANTLTLVVALLIAAVGAWLFWRNRQAAVGRGDSRQLTIDETRSLGNRQYLVVASYEGRKFLLGVCPGRIDMLAPLSGRRASDEETPR